MLCRPYVRIVDEPHRTVVIRPRFDLGQVDVSEGESRKHLEQHAGVFLVREDDARLERPIRSWYDWLTRKHHEPGRANRQW